MKRCRVCLYPDSKPDLIFDDTGLCSACQSFDQRKETDWKVRENELLNLLEQTPSNDTGFDCIVPSSGGKDSHWQVLKLIELGVRPLVVTATTCHLTVIGRKNIDNLAKYATTIEVSPNKEIRAMLNRKGLELVGDISWPEHASIFSTPFRVACDLGIPLIFYGENPQEAYGGPPGTSEAKEMTQRWVSEFGGFLGLRPSDCVGGKISKEDMKDYMPPSIEKIKKVGVMAYFLGAFYEWDSHKNADVAIRNGMITMDRPPANNYWLFENLDNAQTGIHDYEMYLKFGYSRACAQLSVDIRSGKINRKDAMDALKDLEGKSARIFGGYCGITMREILERIGIDKIQLMRHLIAFVNKDIFKVDGFNVSRKSHSDYSL